MGKEFNPLAELGDVLQELETPAKSSGGGGRINNNGEKEDRIPIVFLGNQSFSCRLVRDQKKKWYNHYRLYKHKAIIKREDGTNGPWTYYYAPNGLERTSENDLILETSKKLNDYHFSAQEIYSFFIEVVKVKSAEDEYIKPGPCLLVGGGAVGWKFHTALKTAMKALSEKAKGSDPIGMRLLAQSLSQDQPGLLLDVTSQKGKGGVVTVNYDTLGDPDHVLSEESKKFFVDLTKTYCPEQGEENDKNGKIIKRHYEKILAQGGFTATPDSEEATQESAQKVKDKVPPPSRPAPTKSAVDELDESLEDLLN